MPTTASTITRSPVDAINGLSPGDRRVLNENELAQRWGLSPKTLRDQDGLTSGASAAFGCCDQILAEAQPEMRR